MSTTWSFLILNEALIYIDPYNINFILRTLFNIVFLAEPLNNTVKEVLSPPLFYNKGNQGAETLTIFHSIVELD